MFSSRRIAVIGIFAACGLAACAASLNGSAPAVPATTSAATPAAAHAQPARGDLAYAIGYMLGREVVDGLDADGVQADTDRLTAGFSAAIAGEDPALDPVQMNDALAAVQQAVQERIVQRRLDNDASFKQLHDDNKQRSEAFHRNFASQPGVQTLPSGAQYRSLEAGEGSPAGPDATVVVTFSGALLDGRIFAEGEAVEVDLRTLTPGVRELIAAMRPGDWRQLAVPPELAYGSFGRPDQGIGPNETLLGNVKLLEVR